MERLSATRKTNAHGAALIEEHAICERVTHDPEIGSPPRRGKMRQRSALAHAVDDVSWQNTGSERCRRVVVFDGRKSGRDAGLQESAMFGKKHLRRVASNRNGTAAAVPAIVEVRITLDATKKRKHIGEGPSWIAI